MHGLCKISQLIADSVWCLSKHACTVRYMFKKDVQIKDFNEKVYRQPVWMFLPKSKF